MSSWFFYHLSKSTWFKRLALLALVLVFMIALLGTVRPSVAQTQPWMNTSLTARQRADLLVAAMTQAEKIAMLHGGGSCGYVGCVAGNSRLGIPALNLNDGPAGVGNGKTNVTAFPAPITLAATWDVNLMQQYGQAMGEEFRGKGVNVALAPMMNMDRVPQGGRNWEGYGEDPYLAAQMAYYEIRGLQNNGIIATAKHYIDNEQEINRSTVSSQVDERTQHEIYLPPFKASVQAGVGAMMCAYNRINGVYACENATTQNTFLKNELGYQGWMMSDWGATHSTVASANNGLEQEMPGSTYFGSALNNAVNSGQVSQARLNDMVRRILQSMFAAGLFDRAPSGNVNNDVRSTAHTTVARNAAAQGTVLLKNAGPVLPLNSATVSSIAVIGTAADSNPIVGGGGSGSVWSNSTMVVTALEGIRTRAGSGVIVTYNQGTDTTSAANTARAANVAVVVVGLTSSEGSDRSNLSLPGNANSLISAVAAANPRTIVVVYMPAQVLMPWAGEVEAILVGFLGGVEQGNALASLLFGDVNPSGKLPMTIAVNTSDYPANTTAQYPGVNGVAQYSEGLRVGYRHFDAQNITPLYPFGHGLSYTTFAYANLAVTPGGTGPSQVTVAFDVTNTGSRAGAEVAQLYLGYPSGAGEPPKGLKRFQKVMLQPGQTQRVTFTLQPLDWSYWNSSTHNWAVSTGMYTLMVGSSSRDMRLTGSFSTDGSTPPPSQQPYGGTPAAIPGTIQAENYDTGGEGVAYHDTTAGNSGNVYRADDVDIEATTDTGGGNDVGWTAAGEWLEYTIDVPDNGTYDLAARVSSQAGGGSMHVEIDGVNATGTIAIPSTGAWQTWTTVTRTGISLTAGQHVMRIAEDAAGFNLNWVSFTGGTTPPPTTPPPPSGTMRIEAGNTASFTDHNGNVWLSDRGFTGGSVVDRGAITISNTQDSRIYQTEHYGMSAFALAVPDGTYQVNLHFAETYAGITGAGQRVFSVNVEGTAITGIDVYAEAGGRNIALVRTVTVTVNDGTLNMTFTATVNSAEINGIEIIPGSTPPPPPPSGNLALDRPATSSSNESGSLTPNLAVDGSTATRWASAFSDPQWITVDLGATYSINRVVLNWEAAYGQAYQIQVSNDGSTWSSIYSTSSGNGGTDDLTVSGSGRYVRMYGTARGTQYGYSLWEFEVYGG